MGRPDEHTEKQEDVDHLARAPCRERSPRRKNRDDSRHRSELKRSQTDRLEIPSSWNSSDTHWDKKTEYGLNLPKRVESTQFSRRQNLAGQEISQIKLIDVVQSGISNWGLRLVANGRFVSCEFFRNRLEATFATTLFREMSKQKDTLDFHRLLGAFTPQGQDPQEWDTKLTSIKGLVQSTLDHFRTLCPQDSQQAILEELEELKAENAALKASQAPDSGNPPSQQTQRPPTGQPQINAFFPNSSTPGGPSSPADPLMSYRRKDAQAFYAIQAPQTGTEAKVRDWVKKNVPKERQGELNKCVETLQNHLKQFHQANQPNLEPILSDWGLSSSFLSKCNVDAHIRLLAAVQLLRNWQFEFATDQVSPPTNGGLIKPFDQAHTRKARRKIAQFREIAQSFIFFAACLLQYTPQLTWRLQRMLLWSLSQWTVFGVCLNSWTNKRRRLMTILQHARLPFKFSWTWWTQTSVIYMRLDLWDADFYIGATEHSVFDREQSRMRKFRQLGNQQLAYFEPALKVWFHLNNFYRFGCFPYNSKTLTNCMPWKRQFRRRTGLNTIGHGSSFSYRSSILEAAVRALSLQTLSWKDSKVLSSIFEANGYKSAVRFGPQISFCGSNLHITHSFRLWHHRKVSCFQITAFITNRHTISFLALETFPSIGRTFSYTLSITTSLILRFKGTESPPPNVPMRLQVLSDDMNDAIKQWLLNFTFHHSINFPPFHKVRAPFVRIKNRTLGQTFFNFRKVLKWWTPEQQPLCTCHLFPLHIRQRERKTEHISVFAQECFPDEAFLHQHMAEEISPSWRHFFHHNTYQFEQWLHRWKLSHSLIQYWQAFILTQWKIYKQNSLGQTQKQIQRLQHRLRSFVVSPQIIFRILWHYTVLLSGNIWWTERSWILRYSSLPSVSYSVIEAHSTKYPWLDYATLQMGLQIWIHSQHRIHSPKTIQVISKARPIVDYSRAWCRPIGSALATALYEILQVVYSDLLSVTDIKSVLHAIAKLFSHQDYVYGELTVEQEDIAGFYNQVDHSRMLQGCSICCVSVLWTSRTNIWLFSQHSSRDYGTHFTIFSWILAVT